jgi:hypothetical protein
MRTTIDLDPDVHERMRRQAQREGISLARLLGRVVREAASQATQEAPPVVRSGRFSVIAPAQAEARTTSQAVQKVIDEEGIL